MATQPPIACPPTHHPQKNPAGAWTCVQKPQAPPSGRPPTSTCPSGTSQVWDPYRQTWTCSSSGPVPNPNPPSAPTPPVGVPCPPGQHRGGGHPGNPCKPTKAPAPAGGGGAIVRAPAVAGPAPGEDIESMIRGYLTEAMGGKYDPYSASSITSMRNQAVRTALGGAARQRDQAMEDLINRGMERGGERTRTFGDIERGASAQIGERFGQITIETTRANAEMKLRVLGQMQNWLDQKRDYLLRSESNAIQREIGLAQIKLGYAKISADKEMLQMQLAKMGGGGGGGDDDDDELRRVIDILFGGGGR